MSLSKIEWSKQQEYIAQTLAEAGIVMTPDERENLEVADFGLGDYERQGLGILTYLNTKRCCAKELVMRPFQTCPQHRHPPVAGEAGKEETFRVRRGVCYLHVDIGAPTESPACKLPTQFCQLMKEVVLHPGEQFTLPPNTWHWFQAGPDGCVMSEFSTSSRDDADVFLDPAIRRAPEIEG
jgi:D-lyxose ketol-isomerase